MIRLLCQLPRAVRVAPLFREAARRCTGACARPGGDGSPGKGRGQQPECPTTASSPPLHLCGRVGRCDLPALSELFAALISALTSNLVRADGCVSQANLQDNIPSLQRFPPRHQSLSEVRDHSSLENSAVVSKRLAWKDKLLRAREGSEQPVPVSFVTGTKCSKLLDSLETSTPDNFFYIQGIFHPSLCNHP